MNIIKDLKNNLLKRREVKLVIDAEKNPGMAASSKMIAEQFKSEENTVVVKELKSKFGRNSFLIDAFIYDSAEQKEKIEPRKKVKKAAEGQAPGAGK